MPPNPMPPNRPYPRRATLFVLAAVTVASGGILLLGDRMGTTPGYALRPTGSLSPRVAACLADESLRLINTDREQCAVGEVELAPRPPADR